MTVAIPRSVIDTVLSRAFDDKPAEEILRWGLDTFAPRIALSASFGSPEGMVLLDMMHNIDPAKTRVFTIDTGRLHQETYDLMDRVVPDGEALAAALLEAERYAPIAPLALAATKRMLAEGQSLDAVFAAETREQPLLTLTADYCEGRAAMRDKRTPVFRGA